MFKAKAPPTVAEIQQMAKQNADRHIRVERAACRAAMRAAIRAQLVGFVERRGAGREVYLQLPRGAVPTSITKALAAEDPEFAAYKLSAVDYSRQLRGTVPDKEWAVVLAAREGVDAWHALKTAEFVAQHAGYWDRRRNAASRALLKLAKTGRHVFRQPWSNHDHPTKAAVYYGKTSEEGLSARYDYGGRMVWTVVVPP